MRNISAIWSGLSNARRGALVGALVAIAVAVLMLGRMGGASETALLYAGLDPRVAGEVVAALEQRGVAYQVQGESILVDRALRDRLRLDLAAAGLPATGPQGYELLDSMSGFGTTSQMFDAALLRAKEGELARTILAMPGVSSARVHIAAAPDGPFQRDRRPTASITVAQASGTIGSSQAKAIQHLVAASVGGMTASDVTVIDPVAGIVSDQGKDSPLPQDAQDRAKALKEKAERLLFARVGDGRAVVEVSLDLVSDREQISERRIDPEGRVAISTDSQEKSDQSTDAPADVTVASNLPDGDAQNGQGTESRSSETRERVNFEVSEVHRELLREPGAIRRMTVAVLVDTPPAEGAGASPRTPEELEDLRQLVASAVGYDEARGDVLTLKSMTFSPVPSLGTGAEAVASAGAVDVAGLVKMALAAAVAIALAAFVVRPALMSRARPALPAADPLQIAGSGRAGWEDNPVAPRVVTGEIEDAADGARSGLVDVEATELPNDPVERLRRMIDQRQAESLEILRGWLDRGEETA